MSRESGNLAQACASCKQQRKKCDENCELAPYFPANRMAEFQNAHRLFGVSNIQRLIAAVDPNQRQQAADSVLMEGNLRTRFPVTGSLGFIRNLKSEIEFCNKQLGIVNRYLAFFRQKDQGLGKLDSESTFRTETSDSHLIALPDLDEQCRRYSNMSTLDEDAEPFGSGVLLQEEFDQDDDLDLHMTSEAGDQIQKSRWNGSHKKKIGNLSGEEKGKEMEGLVGEIIGCN